jgi:hypothetical protein
VTPAQHRQGHGSPMTIPLHSEKLLQKSSVIQRSNFSDIEGTPASFLGPLLYLGCFTEKAHPSSHLLQISPLPPRKRLVTAPPSSSCISLPLHSPTLLLQGSCPKTTHFPVFALSTFTSWSLSMVREAWPPPSGPSASGHHPRKLKPCMKVTIDLAAPLPPSQVALTALPASPLFKVMVPFHSHTPHSEAASLCIQAPTSLMTSGDAHSLPFQPLFSIHQPYLVNSFP